MNLFEQTMDFLYEDDQWQYGLKLYCLELQRNLHSVQVVLKSIKNYKVAQLHHYKNMFLLDMYIIININMIYNK